MTIHMLILDYSACISQRSAKLAAEAALEERRRRKQDSVPWNAETAWAYAIAAAGVDRRHTRADADTKSAEITR